MCVEYKFWNESVNHFSCGEIVSQSGSFLGENPACDYDWLTTGDTTRLYMSDEGLVER